ncbi:hypothetical protein [Chamaesiphon sp. OTE_8_metabat_110]|uniref:hypothetical protein n=1 Tax=Chamaesiphon sp. OTE_8_metabat_110 TaxID=2964696 RepID=UPI00286AD60A|nr:hypothetical protein [Chamaesiphon sp. OTE_8_metabat_110]
MATPTLTISGKVLGKSQNLFTSWQMSLSEQPLTLAELLAQIVRSEVGAFQTRQADRRTTKVLGIIDIEAGVAIGKISSGDSDLEQVVDVEMAIDNALQAFLVGFYLVFIDDKQQEDLTATVALTDRSELLYLRLTPLVGG